MPKGWSPCTGCTDLAPPGKSQCPNCQLQTARNRGTTTERGYGHTHQVERARWATILRTRPVPCARCGTPIHPGEPFDLGHTDDRTNWHGPEHQSCNRADGGRKAIQARLDHP